MNILLIAGGWSSEREVSLKGAVGVKNALIELGHEVYQLDPSTELADLPQKAASADFAFLNLHGSPGEDGIIQAMLEKIGLPFQGANSASSMIALNKHTTKILYRNAGLPTPDWIFWAKGQKLTKLPPFPFVVKPNTGGSSVGITIVSDNASWEKIQNKINEDVLLEQCISGLELTCPVLGEKALPPILIKPKLGTFFDYTSKYSTDGAEEICPAPVGNKMTSELQKLALVAHKTLGLRDYSRTDFLTNENGKLFLLETNTLPGMTPTSLVPKSAAAIGMNFTQLIARLIELGINRFSK